MGDPLDFFFGHQLFSPAQSLGTSGTDQSEERW
ncbi:Protein of unknown function [Pyronema omphalodes CBS 100304]|uniref:Uncharacterized protein n=1 Tax=Pyronema omphalodes (strain CBS 100304) TaxID=1076935 RepID=U4LVE2_PYROM|nr:Protein of unknown function [Pyronema omphalodes CBS 100304]